MFECYSLQLNHLRWVKDFPIQNDPVLIVVLVFVGDIKSILFFLGKRLIRIVGVIGILIQTRHSLIHHRPTLIKKCERRDNDYDNLKNDGDNEYANDIENDNDNNKLFFYISIFLQYKSACYPGILHANNSNSQR